MSSDSASPPSAQLASVSVQPGGPVCGSIRPPGSKSLTNRALICAAMAAGRSELSGALRSEDTAVMIDSLGKCGVAIEVADAGRSIRVDGTGRETSSDDPKELFIANSGTTVRFLTAALSAAGGSYRLHGVPRMHERPIADLVDALAAVQVGSIRTLSSGGCPPVEIDSQGWSDRPLRVAGNVSSQYLSGLMMAAPVALAAQVHSHNDRSPDDQAIEIDVIGELVSRPYVEMTAAVMRDFGASVDLQDHASNDSDAASLTVRIHGGGYQGVAYAIEPDASAASYFWAAAAITGGEVTVQGLSPDALQGDVGFCHVLEKMGCTLRVDSDGMTISGRASKGIDIDMNEISDTVQTLAVVALFARRADASPRCCPQSIQGNRSHRRLGLRAAKTWRQDRRARRRPDDRPARRWCHTGDPGNLPRPPHGDEPLAGRLVRPRRTRSGPRLHWENLPRVLCRPGKPDRPPASMGVMTNQSPSTRILNKPIRFRLIYAAGDAIVCKASASLPAR